MALQLIHEAASKLEQQDGHENREFIILVLDPDVQVCQLYPYHFHVHDLHCLTIMLSPANLKLCFCFSLDASLGEYSSTNETGGIPNAFCRTTIYV